MVHVRVALLWALVSWVTMRVSAQEAGFHLEGIESRVLPVTGRKMTNVVFPIEILAGVRVSKDVLVQKVKGVENVIELKAVRRDFPPTNLSVYGKDGRLYSFVLHYVEDTAVLNFRVVVDNEGLARPIRLTGWPVDLETLSMDARLLATRHGFLHKAVSSEGVRFVLYGVFLRDSLMWLGLRVENRVGVALSPGELKIYTQDRKHVKRTATQEVAVMPVYAGNLGIVPGHESRSVAIGLWPSFVGRGRRLVVELTDVSGTREVLLRLKGKTLLKARKG